MSWHATLFVASGKISQKNVVLGAVTMLENRPVIRNISGENIIFKIIMHKL